jgi:hypothetical protein
MDTIPVIPLEEDTNPRSESRPQNTQKSNLNPFTNLSLSTKKKNAMFAHPEAQRARQMKRQQKMEQLEASQGSMWSMQLFIFKQNWEIFVTVCGVMWDWCRYILSALLLLFSFLAVTYAIIARANDFWPESVPAAVSYLLFVLLMLLLFLMEGTMIAVVETMKQPLDSILPLTPAFDITSLMRADDKLQSFLMGRQVLVLFAVLLLGRLTTLVQPIAYWWIPTWFNVGFLQTGIFGALTVCVLAQIVPKIIASEQPVQFLNLGGPAFPFIKWFVYVTLVVDWIGITFVAWGLSRAIQWLLLKTRLTSAEDSWQEVPMSASDLSGLGIGLDDEDDGEIRLTDYANSGFAVAIPSQQISSSINSNEPGQRQSYFNFSRRLNMGASDNNSSTPEAPLSPRSSQFLLDSPRGQVSPTRHPRSPRGGGMMPQPRAGHVPLDI